MRAFLMLVGSGATLTGFKQVTPPQVAMELRMAGSFYRLHSEGESSQADFDRCLQRAVEQGVISFFHEEKDTTPSAGDVTIAMHWNETEGQATFYMAKGPITYVPKPSLPPPPLDDQ